MKKSTESLTISQRRRLQNKVAKAQRKRYSYITYRVTHQEKRPWFPIYVIEVVIANIIEGLAIFLSMLGWIFGICALVGLLFAFIIGRKFIPILTGYYEEAKQIASASIEEDFAINEGSVIYDVNGNVIAQLYETANTEYIEFKDIPTYIVDAFVAVEDQSFWYNYGIDTKGLTRIVVDALASDGEERHGASTITQQLVKNIYLTSEKSLERKFKEMFISMMLTRKYSKEKLIEYYINDICYANGIYGIAGAARGYFNKSVDELTLSECAYLCAIPNRPTYYNPLTNPDNALTRRDKILKDMYKQSYITYEQYLEAKREEIKISRPEFIFNDYPTTYAVDCAIRYLMELDGYEFRYTFEDMNDYSAYHEQYNTDYATYKHKLYTGGYEIYTSLDVEKCKELQAIADEVLSFNKEVNEETGIYKLQSASTVIDNETGKVVAIVGGRPQEDLDSNLIYSYNRAYQAYRQPGSSIKPIIVYTPALQSGFGFTANTLIPNISVTEAKKKGSKPQTMFGTMYTLRKAVESSKNGVAWRVFDKITPKYGMSFITNMKFANICPNDYFNSSSLGGFTYGVSTVEQASAYATLANHGIYKQPTCLVSMKKDGVELFFDYEGYRVYEEFAAEDMVDILLGVPKSGTAAGLKWYNSSKHEVFCKTGTTNSNKDAWLCGSSPKYSIAVWVGFDIPQSMRSLYGATYPGQIWKKQMLAMLGDSEPEKFVRFSEKTNSRYINASLSPTYYTYLEGREDDEMLSANYSVGDYRTDRVIGESVTSAIKRMGSLNKDDLNFMTNLEGLYNEGKSYLPCIKSNSYKSELLNKLNDVYDSMAMPEVEEPVAE